MLASLPMYDRAETRAANDRLWVGVRDRLRDAEIDAPDGLTRADDLWGQWQAPDLVLSQTCGLPFRARLHDRVTLLASPDYGLDGCAPGYYRSVLVARVQDTRTRPEAFSGAPLAFNEALSQSGWAAVWEFARAEGLVLRPALATGSHRASALAVAEGRADWAALDAQTWRMIARWDRFAAGLAVIGATRPTPALSFVTAKGRDPVPIRAALVAAIADMTAQDRDTLGLRGVVELPPEAYLSVPIPPAPELAVA